jgi:hypothetical protein
MRDQSNADLEPRKVLVYALGPGSPRCKPAGGGRGSRYLTSGAADKLAPISACWTGSSVDNIQGSSCVGNDTPRRTGFNIVDGQVLLTPDAA